MLRWSVGPALITASVALAWLAMTACADRNKPVSSAEPHDTTAAVAPSLSGRVMGAKGGPIEGALVQPRSLDGAAVPELAVVTDADGRYSWMLSPGRYEVSVSADGFVTATATATVAERRQATLDFTLTSAR